LRTAAKASPAHDLRDLQMLHIYGGHFQKLTPDFDYSVYFKDVKVRSFDTLTWRPRFFKA